MILKINMDLRIYNILHIADENHTTYLVTIMMFILLQYTILF
jgi:hypothetical protein